MKNFFTNFYKNNFIYTTKEKLSKIVLLAIMLLNIIVFYILMSGLDFQSNFVSNPSSKYSNKCTSVINSDVEQFSNYYYKDNYTKQKYSGIKKDENLLDSRCKTIEDKLALIIENSDIKNLLKQNNELNKNLYKIEDDLNYIRNNYNTVLFEKISNQEKENSILENSLDSKNIKAKYDELNLKYETIKNEKDSLESSFKNSSYVKELKLYIETIKDEYLKDVNKAYDRYFYLVEIIKLIFLLPIVFAFFYLMKRYIKKELYLLYLIFKNLLIVVLIPTLFTVFLIVNKFIPKIFIEKVVEFFYNLNIPFVVYYFFIIVFVAVFIYLIIKLQKRYKKINEINKESKIAKIEFYNKNQCNYCSSKIDYKIMNFCPVCSNRLKFECKNCNEMTIFDLNYCINCSNKIED